MDPLPTPQAPTQPNPPSAGAAGAADGGGGPGQPHREATATNGEPLDETWYQDHFDHLAPALAPRFHETLARVRASCPVTRSDRHGGFWLVTGYDDVLRVAQDWGTFSSAHGLTVPPAPITVRNIPVEVDPPLHRAYRRLINPHLTPAVVARFTDRTRRLVHRLAAGFLADGHCEWMADFARPYPALSFFEVVLDAGDEDIDHVAHLASKSSTPDDPEAAACWAGLSAWIDDLVERRQHQPPRGDILDTIVGAEIDGRPITRAEIVGIVQLLILGGLETTAGALGSMMVRFCTDPAIPRLLRAEPQRIPGAVEELLRLDGPFVHIARTATTDVELGGHPVRAGDKVIISWAAASRDPAEFPDPDRFDPDRPSNRHLAFGAGPHRCAGSNLARLNLRVALEELLPRMADLHLADTAAIEYHTTFTRAPLAVPVAFTPTGPPLTSA